MSIIGLDVQFPRACAACGSNLLRIGAAHELRCRHCDEFAGRMSARATDFVSEVVARWGRPNSPIIVRRRERARPGTRLNCPETERKAK
jgi:hypothetical protein